MITIRALGPVEVSTGAGSAPPALLWRKNLALLVYLARAPRRSRTREHLMALLWGDRQESAARHSLREAIRVVRQALGEDALATAGDSVQLDAGRLDLDVNRFDERFASADWAAAAAIAAGEFMEGFSVPDAPDFEDWLAAERLALRERAVRALAGRAGQLQLGGDLAGSVECARRAVQLDPVSNAAARALMSALALLGERAEALASYERLAALMRETPGAEPDEDTRRLAERIRRERAIAPPAAAAVRAESRRAPLAGRESELAAILERWRASRDGRAQVIVLSGPSGAGKSRLASEAAARARLDGAVTTQIRGTPPDRDAPWSGLLGLAQGGLIDAPGIAATPPRALAFLATRLEGWGDRFPGARSEEPDAPVAAFTALARSVVGEQPVVFQVEDAHWLDAESLGALHSIARDLAACPLLIMLTVDDQEHRAELDQLRSRLGRELEGEVITVAPLGPDALHALARWAMPAWTDTEVDRLARRLAADSAGLPLLAVELLHAVALGLDIHKTPSAWPEPQRTLDQTMPGELPDSLVSAIRIGYRRLSRDAQQVLAAVSVAAHRVRPAELHAATGLDDARLAAALDEAEWHRWLAVDGRGYHFVALVARRVIERDMLTEGQRLRLREQLSSR